MLVAYFSSRLAGGAFCLSMSLLLEAEILGAPFPQEMPSTMQLPLSCCREL